MTKEFIWITETFRDLKVVVEVDSITDKERVVKQIQRQAQGRIILAQGLSKEVLKIYNVTHQIPHTLELSVWLNIHISGLGGI